MTTGEFHIVEGPDGEQVQFTPDRDTPQPDAPGVCLLHSGHEARIRALEQGKRDAAGSWRVIVAGAVGSGVGAAVAYFLAG